MNFLDRAIAALAPIYGRKRMQNRMAIKALYEGGKASRLRRSKARQGSANVSVQRAGTTLRDTARYLEENSDLASGALDILVANVVGQGVRPEPMVLGRDGEPHEEVNDNIRALWNEWIRRPEVTGEMDYWKLQQMEVRSALRDGEVLVRMLTGNSRNLKHGTVVPYSVQALEADFLPLDFTRDRIVQGVELNVWGAPVRYHILKRHPSDVAFYRSTERMTISASQIIHAKMTKRLHQVRGVSVFATVLNRIDDIKEIDESERVAARVAAALVGFIKKGNADSYEAPDANTEDQARNLEMYPGMIMDDLQPGEDVGTINSNRPNNALIDFRDSQMRSGAAGLGVGFSSWSKNYNGTYSAQRQELVEQYQNYGVLWQYFAGHLFQRQYQGFIDAAVSARLIDDLGAVEPMTLYNCDHSRPPLVWIDPVKEAKANEIMADRRWKSDSQIIRERGGNPEETWNQARRDQQIQKEKGLEAPPKAAST